MDRKTVRGVLPQVVFPVLLGGLLCASGAQAGWPVGDDTDAESSDYFGNAFASGDFNGDGYDDLAVGVRESIGEAYWAGAVEIIYGAQGGLQSGKPQFLHQHKDGIDDAPEAGDNFGSSLAAGDFDGDGYDDLAVGVPMEDLAFAGNIYKEDAGSVNVLYGSASGLSAVVRAGQFWHQDVVDVEDVAESGDSFGGSLASGDFNGDGWDDLAIGVPEEDDSAGSVHVLFGSPLSGLSATYVPDQVASQALPNMGSLAEEGDQFGLSLAAADFNGDALDDLAIGIPGEDIAGEDDAGAVNVVHGSSKGLSGTDAQFWHQDAPGVVGVTGHEDRFGWSLAAGDFDGDKNADLAIGAPWESEWGAWEGGVVHVAYGSSRGLSSTDLWHQDTAHVEDVAEFEDIFGWSLATGDFDGNGFDDLAIGVPQETFGKVLWGGAVNVIYGYSAGLDPRIVPNQFWHQDVDLVEDVAGWDDVFGGTSYGDEFTEPSSKLIAGDFNGDGRDDMAVGVPRENLNAAEGELYNAGAVNVIYGAAVNGLNAAVPLPDQFLTQRFLSPPIP